MKFQIEQLGSGYVLDVFENGGESTRSAFQSLQGVLLTVIDMCATKDPRARTVAIKQKYEARFACIVEVLKSSGKNMTVNEVAIRAADLMGKEYSAHFQRGVAVVLTNASTRANSPIERAGELRSGLYRFREVKP